MVVNEDCKDCNHPGGGKNHGFAQQNVMFLAMEVRLVQLISIAILEW